ncbi:MAG TPA: bifunctional metallophosphatase/5'-nucleotidase [Ornithinibacter sp.]|nr:bifunctional metallophosphatase/5'-nucleotidase [Ornithinibacter sp.]
MTTTHRRAVGAGIAAAAIAALVAGTPAMAGPGNKPAVKGNPNLTSVQLLSFNDYHGRLQATEGPLSVVHDPTRTPVGGAEYLSTKLTELRSKVGDSKSLTVAAGDLIGGSPFLSGLFHDEPSVESLNVMGLDVSSVGNHEFDEGTDELLRMQEGGCHPVDGCYFPDEPYAGADFPWLAANVINKDDGSTFMPGTWVKEISGTKVGFIGMTLEGTDLLVSPGGIESVTFKDEVETANAAAQTLKRQGVKAIVVLMHEGGANSGTYNECVGISEPIATMATQFSPEIDQIVTGHTHNPYVCSIPDPAGNPRFVTSAADYGRVVTETNLVINTRSGEVDRGRTTSTNHLVTRTTKDPALTEVIDKWDALSGPLGRQVVGSHVEDIIGHSSPTTNRAIETPMGALVADAILWGTSGANGGAQIALMNVGGVRESLPMAPRFGEGEGNITYSEAYAIAPFGNLLNTLDLTGAQLKAVLEQQYQTGINRAPMLSLCVSEGFTYTWDASRPEGSRVVAESMRLNGVPMSQDATYRVATLSFLAQGGDAFTAFKAGTNLTGGPEDLANLVNFFKANPGLSAPTSRIDGL